jgi:hypothetical protein
VADIAGSQRQIDLDLIASLQIRSDFLECVRAEREKLFNKLVNDPEAEPDEYLTHDFGLLEDIASNEFNVKIIPEDTKTPLNVPTGRIMRKFRLPTHFYIWTLTWLDKGVKPRHLPAIMDLDILVRSTEYLKAGSGLPADTKRKLKQYLAEIIETKGKEHGKKTTKAIKEMSKLLDKIPKNVHRKKPVIDEVIKLLQTKNSSYSDIAFSSVYDTTGGFDPEDEIKAKRISNKLRKRKSHYKAKI